MRYSFIHLTFLCFTGLTLFSPLGDVEHTADADVDVDDNDEPSGRVAPHRIQIEQRSQLQRPKKQYKYFI